MVRGRGRVEGIGGAFLFSARPRRLAGWYRAVLGIPLKSLGAGVYYIELYHRSLAHPRKRLHSVFAIMPTSGHLAARRNQAMINLRVDDLERLVRRIREFGVEVDPIHTGPDAEGEGKFTHVLDLDGNRLELWEPSTGV